MSPRVTPTPDVSVVVLTRNPGPALRDCLDSVAWAGEIIAVDDDSDDGTRELLRERGATILRQDRDLIRAHAGNFDVARNPAFERATRGWILVLDADEIVTPPLRDETLEVTSGGGRVAFEIPRRNLYWGRPSRVLGEDRQLRLFPRGAGRYRGDRLDQRIEVDCPVESLTGPLLHRQTELLAKLRRRTDQRARAAVRRGDVPETPSVSLFWHHLRWYLLEQEAWRDGPRGLALATLYAAYPALEARKARRLQRAASVRP